MPYKCDLDVMLRASSSNFFLSDENYHKVYDIDPKHFYGGCVRVNTTTCKSVPVGEENILDYVLLDFWLVSYFDCREFFDEL